MKYLVYTLLIIIIFLGSIVYSADRILLSSVIGKKGESSGALNYVTDIFLDKLFKP